MNRFIYILPLAVFVVLAGYFAVGLTKDPSQLESVLIDQPIRELDLPPIKGADIGLKTEDIKGEVSLVNFFGSWCVACLQEHPFLQQLAANDVIPIYGIDWDEKNPDDVVRWLARHGNPYTKIGVDETGHTILDYGVTGAPETFIVDREGIIRYKQVGPITPPVWEETLWPIIKQLRAEG